MAHHKLDISKAYHRLFKSLNEQNKHISRRYDDIRGSTYIVTVAAILNDGYISEEGIKDFSPEAKQQVNTWLHLWKDEE